MLKQRLGGARLDWANPNNREFSYVDAQGALVHVVIFDSETLITNAEQLAKQQAIDAQNYSDALMEGEYQNGAVTFNHFTHEGNNYVMGLPIRDAQGSIFHGGDIREKVFEVIHQLPVVERERILSKQFANFILKMDLGAGIQQEVMASVIFPRDRDVIDTISSDNDIDMYRNGHLTLKITSNEVVVPLYDNLGVEIQSIKYQNPYQYESRPSDIGAYVKKSRRF